MTHRCLFCGGNADEPDHLAHCDGRQGGIEEIINGVFDAHTHARASDPDTSHAAAWAVQDASEVQRRVVAIHKQHAEGLTDEALVTLYQHDWPSRALESKASARKRRSDLTRLGVLVDSGERRVLTTGRRGIVWKLAS